MIEKVNVQRCIVAHLDSFPLSRVLRDRQARLASHKGPISLRELQSETQKELDALLPPVLRPLGGAFKGEL